MGITGNALHARTVALLSFFCAAATFSQTQRQPAADLIITNAKVWTVDKAIPSAQAVAILGERIERRWTANTLTAGFQNRS